MSDYHPVYHCKQDCLWVVPKGEPLDGQDLLEDVNFKGGFEEGLDGLPAQTHVPCNVIKSRLCDGDGDEKLTDGSGEARLGHCGGAQQESWAEGGEHELPGGGAVLTESPARHWIHHLGCAHF